MKEKYMREVAKKLMEIKAVVDNYTEGNADLSLYMFGNELGFFTSIKNEDGFHCRFNAASDIENGEINGIKGYSEMIYEIGEGEF